MDVNGAKLAYLGDSVIELAVRRMLVERGVGDVGEMNRVADSMVRASAQSAAMDRLMPLLTEDELAAYKRGRNTHSHTVPKSAKMSEYRKATGMESLFGYLYLNGREERIKELFSLAYSQE